MRLGVNGRFYGVPVWGVQRFAREVCARLPAGEGDVTLFLPAGVSDSRVPPVGRLVRGRLAGHLWEQLELPWLSRRDRCDAVLHVSGTAPVWGGPHVVTVHDVFPLTNPEWFTRPFVLWYRMAVARAAARAAVVLVPSAWAGGRLVRILGIPADRIRVVGQGVEPFGAPAPGDEVRRVRERFDLPDPYLLAVGGSDRRKNLAFLVRTLARWAEGGDGGGPPTLVVVGSHRARVHGRERAPGGFGPDARVLRLGYVDDRDLRALYTGARVFCFPSLGEGFGRPPLEAMACGTPAVVADYGPAREVLGEAALVLPLDPDAWARGVGGLLAAGEERDRRIREGLRHVRGLSWNDAAATVMEACRAAARAGPRGNGREA